MDILFHEHHSPSEAEARLSEIADEVHRTHERVHVTRNSQEYIVLLSVEDLESLAATIELVGQRRVGLLVAGM